MKQKRYLIPVILFIISLVGISFYGGPVTYVFFWLSLLVPLFCFIYIAAVIFSLKIYQKSDGRDMVSSVPSDFYITLNNEGPFSFSSVRIVFYSSFSTVTGLDEAAVYELLPKTSVTRKTTLICKYRGQYEVGIKEIIVGDPLELFHIRYRIKEPLNVIVSPAIKHLDILRAGDDIPSAGKDSLMNRTEPDIPVREYVPGDDIRLLNSRASAVMQKMMIRERVGTEKNGVAIIMDPGRCHEAPERYLPVENRIIESTLALSLYYMEHRIPADVFFYTGSMVRLSVTAAAEFDNLYTHMKGYSFRDKASTVSLLDGIAATAASGYEMLIFILHETDPQIRALIDRINIGRAPVRIYLVCTDENGAAGYDINDGLTRIIRTGTERPTEDVL